MKKVIILQHNGGQLCNQLWNFAGIYAYCLEKGYRCENYSFFEYSRYFKISVNRIVNFLFFKTFNLYVKFLPFRIARKIGRILYKPFVFLIKIFKGNQYFYGGHFLPRERKDFFYLPPTFPSKEKLAQLESNSNIKTIYIEGWLIRNPKGLLKFQKKIREYFMPKREVRQKIDGFLEDLKKRYKKVIGVHIRQKAQGDGKLKDIEGRKSYIFPEDMNLVTEALQEYLSRFNEPSSACCFVVCSNKTIDTSPFRGLNIIISQGNCVEDLYLLSKTDLIFGCRSTFSTFASYLGNRPLIFFNKNGVNWEEMKERFLY